MEMRTHFSALSLSTAEYFWVWQYLNLDQLAAFFSPCRASAKVSGVITPGLRACSSGSPFSLSLVSFAVSYPLPDNTLKNTLHSLYHGILAQTQWGRNLCPCFKRPQSLRGIRKCPGSLLDRKLQKFELLVFLASEPVVFTTAFHSLPSYISTYSTVSIVWQHHVV